MQILVTGAAGFIGSSLVDRLLARGDSVVGLDNFDPFYSPAEKRSNLSGALKSPGFRLVEGDLNDRAAVDAALDGTPPEAIVHLAAKAGVRPSLQDPEAYVRVNVLGTQVLLQAAQQRGVSAFVFGSSSSVYGNSAQVPFSEDAAAVDPVSPYAATKRAAELLCRVHQDLYGGSMLCLRFFTVYGPRQRPDLAVRKFCSLISSGRPIPLFGDGSSERDYTWVDDILDGVIAAIERSSKVRSAYEIINLGGSRAVRLARLVELLGSALGVEPTIEWLPAQTGDVERTWADVTKAHELLGYSPRTSIENGIPRFVEWFRSCHPAATPELAPRAT